MPYIGKEPAVANFVKLDAISTSSTNTYNLTLDSVAFTPESANHMLVSLNGVIQAPLTSFSVSGSTITFLPSSGTLSSSDSIDFIMVYGNVLDIGTPSDSTVTNAKTNFVSTSSAAGLQIKGDGTTDGTLQLNCSQNSHGIKLASPAHSAGQSYKLIFPSGNVTAGKFLKVDSVSGSGTTGIGTMTFADAGGGKILQVVSATDSTERSTTSTSFALNSSTLTLNITPASTSNKIYVVASFNQKVQANDGVFTIFRDSTNLGSDVYGLNYILSQGGYWLGGQTISVIDTPSSTSSLTYQVRFRSGSGNTITLNHGAALGNITAFEIEG